jgi:hypothetical protein
MRRRPIFGVLLCIAACGGGSGASGALTFAAAGVGPGLLPGIVTCTASDVHR